MTLTSEGAAVPPFWLGPCNADHILPRVYAAGVGIHAKGVEHAILKDINVDRSRIRYQP